MERKIFLRGEVVQPLWLPTRFSKFVQTYKFGEKHTRNLIAYHENGNYDEWYQFAFGGREMPVDMNEHTGRITANLFATIQAMRYSALRKEGYEEGMASICEREGIDAFFAPEINKPTDTETLMLMIDFAYLYFSIGSANGDYREEGPNSSVAKRGIILPGNPKFKVPR